MSIIMIEIKNFKSIHSCRIDLNRINVLLGENGTGKSNILRAVRYFYDNLIARAESDDIFDHNNRLNNRVEIALTYDLGRLKKYSYTNLKNEDTRYKSYYKKIIEIAQDDRLIIKMVKIRDQPIRWSHDSQVRKLIFGMFPLYFVDTREINLVNWEVLWKHVGDLTKLENKKDTQLKDSIINMISTEDPQLNFRLEKIRQILDQQNIRVTPYSKNEFAKALSYLYFNGEKFGFEEGKLTDLSNGTSSFNFTYLLIFILRAISETKMKEPMVLLDEPEISLHNRFIDSLTEAFYECKNHVCFLMSSHSPRLVRDILIQEGEDQQLYQVYQEKNETKVSRFQLFKQEKEQRERFFITDQHASAYFAKGLLLVEGETELEVFLNKYLREVFPALKAVEVVKGMSNDVVYRIVSPKDRNCHIPTTILLDLDKLYTYKEGLKKKYFDMCKCGENYYYFKKRDRAYSSQACLNAKRSRIINMANKCKFHYEYPFYTSKDENYEEFRLLMKQYLKAYGIFMANTTIEGMMVTEENLQYFLEFLEIYFPHCYGAVFPFDPALIPPGQEIVFIRLLLGGESDYGFTYKQLKEIKKSIMERSLKKIEKNRISKTAWVTDWLKFYFCRQAGIDFRDHMAFHKFSKYIQDDKNLTNIQTRFRNDFSELDQLIYMIYHML